MEEQIKISKDSGIDDLHVIMRYLYLFMAHSTNIITNVTGNHIKEGDIANVSHKTQTSRGNF